MQNSTDLGVGPDLGPNCLNELSADDITWDDQDNLVGGVGGGGGSDNFFLQKSNG